PTPPVAPPSLHDALPISGGERLRKVPLPVAALRELDHRARQLRLRRHEVEIREARVLRKLLQRRAVKEVVARSPVRAHPEAGGQIGEHTSELQSRSDLVC